MRGLRVDARPLPNLSNPSWVRCADESLFRSGLVIIQIGVAMKNFSFSMPLVDGGLLPIDVQNGRDPTSMVPLAREKIGLAFVNSCQTPANGSDNLRG